MLRALAVGLLADGAAGLVLPIARTGAAPRRSIVARLSTSGAALAGAFAAAPVVACDSIPTVEPDFGHGEGAQRAPGESCEAGESCEGEGRQASSSRSSSRMDALALWVIGGGNIPEGVGVKELVKRITIAYDALPKGYACEATRTNNGICYAGQGRELAYEHDQGDPQVFDDPAR